MGTAFVIGAAILLFAIFAPKRAKAAPAPAAAPALPPKPRRSEVIDIFSLPRGLREKWRGVTGWPADAPAPKFAAGQKVTIQIPKDPTLEFADPADGKTAAVVALTYSEHVAKKPDGTFAVLPLPGVWGYVLDLKIDEQPVQAAESVLVAA
jgi:hypothetical protein